MDEWISAVTMLIEQISAPWDRMGGWKGGKMHGYMDGLMDEWRYGWIDG